MSQALGYITAAKYGLSEVELLDLLASDGEVSTYWVEKKKRLRGKKKNALPDRESNPGLPRDRRRYLPLYYRGSACEGHFYVDIYNYVDIYFAAVGTVWTKMAEKISF